MSDLTITLTPLCQQLIAQSTGIDLRAIEAEAQAQGIEPLTQDEYDRLSLQLWQEWEAADITQYDDNAGHYYRMARGLLGRPIPEQ